MGCGHFSAVEEYVKQEQSRGRTLDNRLAAWLGSDDSGSGF
jgi:hypothetical protein